MVWDSERAAQSGSFCIEMKGVEVRFTSITTRWKVELVQISRFRPSSRNTNGRYSSHMGVGEGHGKLSRPQMRGQAVIAGFPTNTGTSSQWASSWPRFSQAH